MQVEMKNETQSKECEQSDFIEQVELHYFTKRKKVKQ